MYLLGYDVGSSSVKATLMQIEDGKVVVSATSPKKEMEIIAQQPGWAEQPPDLWWQNLKTATAEIKSAFSFDPADIQAIGISYQMHGLVIIDSNCQVLRPAIIWCDSRAVEIGEKAAQDIGREKCLENLLNSPGNFTASKLKWVMENEPDIFRKVHKVILPGDYIAMKITGTVCTTESGLSEMIFWDFKNSQIADFVIDNFGFSPDLIADTVPTFAPQGELTKQASAELGLKAGTPITYRAGDQPNNALSLNVLNPGEIAATAGTSGVVYGIGQNPSHDTKSRVNTFIHVNDSPNAHRYGVLLCVSGTGILNSWIKHNITDGYDYDRMNDLASNIDVGCDGLRILPFGNGAERTLENKNIGSCISGLNFNIHTKSHLLRAAQEGIVFALNYGLEIMHDMGIEIKKVRAGDANMFLSPLFQQAFATVTDTVVELYNTDGSQGAARGAGIGAGIYKDSTTAFNGLKCTKVIDPDPELKSAYRDAYHDWLSVLNKQLI